MIDELLPEPTADECVISVYTGILQASATAAADALTECVLTCVEQREAGENYQPDPQQHDELISAMERLDNSWRGYVRRVGKSAGPIVAEAIESYLGPDIAGFVEIMLDRYRRECLPGYAASQDFCRERAKRDVERANER
jgi:hypothetical protein